MRARYSAYVVGELSFLLRTRAPETFRTDEAELIEDWMDHAEWDGLEVITTLAGGPRDAEGIVEFAASFYRDGELQRHHERSRFRRGEEGWLYVDAIALDAASKSVGRNDPCPCGSGRKFKKCCGR